VALASGQAETAHFYARGGLETAVYRLVYPSTDAEKQKRLLPYRDGMNHFWIASGDWLCHVAVQDEAGKIDLNFASEEMMMRLIQSIGIAERQAEALAESVVQWREPERSAGAAGQRATSGKRRLFSSVEQLLSVDGMNREILYGSVRKGKDGEVRLFRGLADAVTVYSEKAQVNLNYAEPEVIAALPGIDSEIAEVIVSARAEESLSTGRMAQRIANLIPGEAASFITTDPSRIYSLVATAFLKDSKLRTSVRAVVKLDGTFKWGHTKLIWYDEYWPSERILKWNRTLPAFETLEAGLNVGG
jgi:general secretion pathway protein K